MFYAHLLTWLTLCIGCDLVDLIHAWLTWLTFFTPPQTTLAKRRKRWTLSLKASLRSPTT